MIDPVKAIQGVYAAVEKYNDVPLMKQIVDLQSQVMEQQMELTSVRQQLQTATGKLSLREKLTRRGPANYYYLEGENDPLCPVCWERDGRLTLCQLQNTGAVEFAGIAKSVKPSTGKSRCRVESITLNTSRLMQPIRDASKLSTKQSVFQRVFCWREDGRKTV
jgi:hypothetical protein